MIPTLNMLETTFCIRQGNSLGAAFAIVFDQQHYLVTARHVIKDYTAPIHVSRNGSWQMLSIASAHPHPGSADVAVIPLSNPLTTAIPLTPSAKNVMMGQNVLIGGFPFGWTHPQTDLNDGYPIPFIKGAILSSIVRQDNSNVVLLDGHNNKGFSGGPIIAEDLSQRGQPSSLRTIGVVSGFEPEPIPHPKELSKPPQNPGLWPIAEDHIHLANSGFFIGYEIQHAVEIIQSLSH